MVSFKEVSFLTNLKADIVPGEWPAVPVCNSVPVPSSQGKFRHAYLTQKGILIYCHERQVAIGWDEIFKFVEAQFTEMVPPTVAQSKVIGAKKVIVSPPPADAALKTAVEKTQAIPQLKPA